MSHHVVVAIDEQACLALPAYPRAARSLYCRQRREAKAQALTVQESAKIVQSGDQPGEQA